MEKRRSGPKVDVVQIVQQIRRQIEEQHTAQATASQVRQEVRDRLLIQWRQLPFPEDVKKDVADRQLQWVLDPDAVWVSRRPGWGPVLTLLRRLFRPLLKVFFNPDPLLHYVHRLGYIVQFQNQVIEDLLVERELLRRDSSDRPRPRRFSRSGRRKPSPDRDASS